MKLLLLFAFCINSLAGIAQNNDFYPSSDSIVISGLVNKQMVLTIHDLVTMPDSAFGTMKIVNHRGEVRSTLSQVKAISLKKVLEGSLPALKPKEMNNLYFSCKAMDGYSIVLSYNEIFNTSSPTIFILTSYDYVDLRSMHERPVLLTTTSPGVGRLGMRGLKSIEVKKAE